MIIFVGSVFMESSVSPSTVTSDPKLGSTIRSLNKSPTMSCEDVGSEVSDKRLQKAASTIRNRLSIHHAAPLVISDPNGSTNSAKAQPPSTGSTSINTLGMFRPCKVEIKKSEGLLIIKYSVRFYHVSRLLTLFRKMLCPILSLFYRTMLLKLGKHSMVNTIYSLPNF